MTALSKMNRSQLETEARKLGIDPSTLTVPDLRAKIVEAQDAAGDPDPFQNLQDEQAHGEAAGTLPQPDPDVVDSTAVELTVADEAKPTDHPPSDQLAPVSDDAARDAFRAMALADEQQIVDELQGRALDVMVYSFPMDGKPTTGLSWKGVREVARTLNARGFTQIRVARDVRPIFEDVLDEEGNPAWEVHVYAEDARNGGGTWGVAQQPKQITLREGRGKKPDAFAKTKALSKAQRNAIESLIPAELIEALKAQYLGQGKVRRLPGTLDSGGDNRPPALTDDHAKDQVARCRSIYDELKRLNRMLVPPGMFNRMVMGAEHDHGRLDDTIAHLESLRDNEAEIALLTSVLADHCDTRQRFDQMMKAVDKVASAGQSARLDRLRKFIVDEGIQDKVDAAEEAGDVALSEGEDDDDE